MKGIRVWILLFTITFVESQQADETCGELEFQCTSGQCVSSLVQCDGAQDCADGSDETEWLCRKLDLTCSSPGSFKCTYGACIDSDKVCDGIKDCADNSDELNPKCLKDFLASVHKKSRCDPVYDFTCHSGECVDSFAVCDGVADCQDGTDESLIECFNMTCQPNAHQCAYGACIDGSPDPVCNGKKNCIDGSDEDPKLCSAKLQPKPTRPPKISNDGVQCLLPPQPTFGSYSIAGCEEGSDDPFCESRPGTPVEIDVTLMYKCEKGYHLPESDGEVLIYSSCLSSDDDSTKGQWSLNITCRKNCEPVFSDTMDLKCTLHGREVPCSEYARPNTVLRPKCKKFFHVAEPVTAYESTMCLDTGKWKDSLYKCIPDSDTKNTQNQAWPENENTNERHHGGNDCHSNFPPMSDRELLCLALLNAGVAIENFQSPSDKPTETQNPSKCDKRLDSSGESQTGKHDRIPHLLGRLMNYLANEAKDYYYFRTRFSCYNGPKMDKQLRRAQKALEKINNTVAPSRKSSEPSCAGRKPHSNVLQVQLQKRTNNLEEVIRRCKNFAQRGMDDLLDTLKKYEAPTLK